MELFTRKHLALLLLLLVGIPIAFFYWRSDKVNKSQATLLTFEKSIHEGSLAIDSALVDQKNALTSNLQSAPKYIHDEHLKRDRIGVFTNVAHDMPSNTYLPKSSVVNADFRQFLRLTDFLEPLWQGNKLLLGDKVAWQYAYHTKSNGLRGFPWVPFGDFVGPEITWPLVDFLSKKENQGLSKKAFCNQPYQDTGGTGLMVSCCDVFDPGSLGNSIIYCIDVPLQKSLEEFRTLSFSDKSNCIRNISLNSTSKVSDHKKLFWTFHVKDGKYASGLKDQNASPPEFEFRDEFYNLNFYVSSCQKENWE